MVAFTTVLSSVSSNPNIDLAGVARRSD
jgi:hypothetical protein